MSTVAPAPPPAAPSPNPTKGTKTDRLIDDRIAEACRALWWAELTRGCLRLVLTGMLALLVWLVVDQWLYSPGLLIRSLVFLGVLVAGGSYVWFRIVPLLRSRVSADYAARSLERDLPDLRQSLTSYVTLRQAPVGAGLRNRVVRSMGAATAGRLRSYDELPTEATGTLRWWIATAGGLAILFAYAVVSPKNSFQSAARLAAPLAAIDPPNRVSIRDVQPGDAEAIAGRTVAISAIIEGLNESEIAVCRWTLPAEERDVAMAWNETDRRFQCEIDLPYSVSGQVPYTISAGDAEAGPFRLSVEDLPVVALQSVHYAPPAYTGQEPHTTSTGAITALDGTVVTITATTNRPVEKAKIEFNPKPLGDRVHATAGATEMEIDSTGTLLTVSFPLRSARGRSAAVEPESYRISVADDSGQTNPDPIVYPIRVIADLPPEVSITLPFASPTEVSIDAQQIIEVHASDPDFGLKMVGLELRSGIDTIATPVLWNDPAGGKGNQVVEFAFRPTRYQLRIGDEVQVVAVAVDNRMIENDPSVEPNTTRTDPIILKITAADPNQTPNLDEADRPPQRNDGSQEQSSNDDSQSSGQEGEPQSGQGGGGSGQDATGQSQSDSNSGEGGSGQRQDSAEGQEDSEGGAGGGSSESSDGSTGQDSNQASGDTPPSGDGQSGQPAGDASDQGNAETSENPSNDPSGDSGSAGDPNGQPSQEMDSQPNSGEPEGGGESSSAEGSSSSSAEGNPSTEGTNRQQGEASGDGQTGSRSDASGQPSQGQGGGADQAPKEAPQHDGEAFERIKDYLEKEKEKQRREAQTGESSSQNQTGESQSGESQSGESQSGESQSGESQSGESQSGESQSGESQSGESQTGESQTGESQTGESESGESQSGESQSGESQSGESQSGESQSGESQSGESQTGESETGESQSGESPSGESPSGESPSGESPSGESQTGESQSGESSPKSESGESSQTGDLSDSKRGSDSRSNSMPRGGTGDGSDTATSGQEAEGAPDAPPASPNLEYTKKATDMVLDYLNETRDAPDRKLLEELQWDEQDLRRFSERWNRIRELNQPAGAGTQNPDLEEALRSLGMRPPTKAGNAVRESADALGGIRDAGNRKPPPAAFRDAFDAFRRSLSP